MHGYRDHCIRMVCPPMPLYCPYYMYQFPYQYYRYRQKSEEYPAYHHKRPQNPPPNYIPKVPASVNLVEASMISPCNRKYTYLWLKNGESFWSYIVYTGKRGVLGWKYTEGRWKQFHLRLKEIKNFTCT